MAIDSLPDREALQIRVAELERENTQLRAGLSPGTLTGAIGALMSQIVILDANGIIIGANDAWEVAEPTTAIGIDCVVGDNYLEALASSPVIAPAVVADATAAIRAVLDGRRRLYSREFNWTTGHLQRWFELRVTPLPEDHSGAIVVSHLDLTRRVHAEDMATATNRELSQIMQTASEAIIVVNADYRIRSFNEGAERTFGYAAAEVLGEPLAILLPDDARAHHTQHLQAFTAGSEHGRDKDARSEVRGKRKDGTIFPAEASIGKMDTAQGAVLMVILRDVSEQRRLHEALERSERQYRALVDGATDFIYEIDLAGRILFMNRAALTTLGYTAADLPDLNFLDLLIDGDHTQLMEDAGADRSSDDRRSASVLQLRARDGREIALEVRSWLVRDSDGRPQSVRSVARDVTQERAAETAKAGAERRYQRLVENSRDAVLEMDLRGNLLYASPAMHAMLGYSAEEAAGLAMDDVMPASDIARFRELIGRNGRPTEADGAFLFRARHANGQWRWIEGSGAIIPSEDGAPPGLQAVLRDVTERTELSRKLDTVLENAPVLLATIDTDGRYTSYDDRGLRSDLRNDNQDPRSVLGESVWDLHADEPDRLVPWRRALGGERGEIEIEIGEGTYRVHYGPFRDPVGEIAGATALAIDISETRQAQAALQASEDQLRHAQKMEAVGRLAGGVAHDFNNLLMVISGYCEVLHGRLPEGSTALRELGRIQSAADSAARLTKQLLAFSRRQALQPAILKLNSIILGMEPMLQRIISEEITFSVELDRTVRSVEADPTQIEQAVLNLCVNACDAMPSGGTLKLRTERIEIGPDQAEALGIPAGAYCCIVVQDTGVGMDQETRDQIFEPFFTTKGVGEGTGLGLASVYGFVGQSGGKIEVDSTLGSGTTFRIYLPEVQAVDAPVSEPESAARAPGTERILLVEDEDSVRSVIERCLARDGYQVVTAANGPAAVREFEQFQPGIDLLITDVVMPGMRGPELATELCARDATLKVIYLSGYAQEFLDGVTGDADAPAHRFIQKPFGGTDLLQAVREVLDSAA